MHGKGQVNWGGVLGAAVIADITMDDGRHFHFKGGMGEIGTPNGGYGILEGDFPGLDHIIGSCALETAQYVTGPGFVQFTFFDLHGTIGTLIGQAFGGGIDFGIGGGSWEEAVAATEG